MSLFPVRSKRNKAKASTNGRSTFHPRLEVLESRDLLSTFTVLNTSGNPDIANSLPWAINQSNATPGTNEINFSIGSGPQVININAVQNITNPVVINGTTQPGYNGAPLISIQGNSSIPVLLFFTQGSAGSTVEGLDTYNYTGNAITTTGGSNGNLIQNNWMGFYIDPSGGIHLNSALGYSFTSDIGIQSSNNTVRSNVLSGVYNAVSLGEDPAKTWSGTVYSGNSITANYFGTDPSGSTAQGFGNQSDAIFLGSGSQGNFLGPNNVMSGALHGVEINAPTASGNIIFRNDIGTDKTGTHAIPNEDGVDFSNGANGNTVGGSFGGNVIAGNRGSGVNCGVQGFGSGNNNLVQGNIIGLNGSQTGVLGTGIGVSINSGSTGNHVLGNVLCGATFDGVYLQDASSNVVTGNWIGESSSGTGFANTQFGIALVQGSDNNDVSGNFFGVNNAGNFFIDSSSTGNNTGGAGGPTGGAGAIQQLFQDYATLLQAIASGNISLAFQEFNNIISLYIQIILSLA